MEGQVVLFIPQSNHADLRVGEDTCDCVGTYIQEMYMGIPPGILPDLQDDFSTLLFWIQFQENCRLS